MSRPMRPMRRNRQRALGRRFGGRFGQKDQNDCARRAVKGVTPFDMDNALQPQQLPIEAVGLIQAIDIKRGLKNTLKRFQTEPSPFVPIWMTRSPEPPARRKRGSICRLMGIIAHRR